MVDTKADSKLLDDSSSSFHSICEYSDSEDEDKANNRLNLKFEELVQNYIFLYGTIPEGKVDLETSMLTDLFQNMTYKLRTDGTIELPDNLMSIRA